MLLKISGILKRFLLRNNVHFSSSWITDETWGCTYLRFKELFHISSYIIHRSWTLPSKWGTESCNVEMLHTPPISTSYLSECHSSVHRKKKKSEIHSSEIKIILKKGPNDLKILFILFVVVVSALLHSPLAESDLAGHVLEHTLALALNLLRNVISD